MVAGIALDALEGGAHAGFVAFEELKEAALFEEEHSANAGALVVFAALSQELEEVVSGKGIGRPADVNELENDHQALSRLRGKTANVGRGIKPALRFFRFEMMPDDKLKQHKAQP